MIDFLVAIGLVLVIEGALYALFPDAMKKMAETVVGLPAPLLRKTGLVAAFIGFVIVWILKT